MHREGTSSDVRGQVVIGGQEGIIRRYHDELCVRFRGNVHANFDDNDRSFGRFGFLVDLFGVVVVADEVRLERSPSQVCGTLQEGWPDGDIGRVGFIGEGVPGNRDRPCPQVQGDVQGDRAPEERVEDRLQQGVELGRPVEVARRPPYLKVSDR